MTGKSYAMDLSFYGETCSINKQKSNMKILYDSQAFDMQTHGGVSRYFSELISHLPQSIETDISVIETNNIYLKAQGKDPIGTLYKKFLWHKDSAIKHFIYKLYYNVKNGAYNRLDRTPPINRFESIKQIKDGDFDLMHPTFFDPYFLRFIGSKPFVVTIHDMIPELFPQYYDRNDIQIRHKHIALPQAAHIIAVSLQTKTDLCRIMDIKEEQVSVVYHGADESQYIPNNNEKNFEYILYVGERHFYKNFNNFIKSCLPILKRHKELKVICTGKPFNDSERKMFKEYGIENRVTQIFVESDQEMLDLYHYALAFVYPSSYEGFGLPILEAYKADCPVLLNNASCFPEIAGDAAIYFNMNENENNFEEQFEMFYHLNGTERKDLIKRQHERLKRYSWEKSAKQSAEIYKRII